MTGFHCSQSGLQCGDEVQEGAGVCLQNPAAVVTAAVTTSRQEQTHRQHGNDLLTD